MTSIENGIENSIDRVCLLWLLAFSLSTIMNRPSSVSTGTVFPRLPELRVS